MVSSLPRPSRVRKDALVGEPTLSTGNSFEYRIIRAESEPITISASSLVAACHSRIPVELRSRLKTLAKEQRPKRNVCVSNWFRLGLVGLLGDPNAHGLDLCFARTEHNPRCWTGL